MPFSELMRNFRYYFTHQHPRAAAKMSLAEVGAGAVRRLQPFFPQRGTPIYDLDWDLLIVLDTCRVDALAAVAGEYDFLPETIPAIRSVGSKTREWMTNTFTEEYADEVANTGYITFNGHSDELLTASDFEYLGEVWRTHWEIDLGGVPPRPITDYTIATGRASDPEYLIAHYKQPHQPYVHLDGFDPTNRQDDTANDRSGVFGALIEGKFSREEIWDAYLDELRWALDDVEILLDNIDADQVAITADHGECFGEWGVYGHHGCMLVPELVQVPYVDGISATDHGEHEPDVALAESEKTQDVDDQLRALGYK